jgi:hypothetical protein
MCVCYQSLNWIVPTKKEYFLHNLEKKKKLFLFFQINLNFYILFKIKNNSYNAYFFFLHFSQVRVHIFSIFLFNLKKIKGSCLIYLNIKISCSFSFYLYRIFINVLKCSAWNIYLKKKSCI